MVVHHVRRLLEGVAGDERLRGGYPSPYFFILIFFWVWGVFWGSFVVLVVFLFAFVWCLVLFSY